LQEVGIAAIANVQEDSLAELARALRWAGRGDEALNELLAQGTVLTWSSLEVFFREFLRVCLNTVPALRLRLAKAKKLRKDYGIEAFGWSELIEADFDLRNCLGDIVMRRFDIKSIDTAKSVFEILFAGVTPVHVAIADPQLEVLAARRHLIVHRRRVVDQKYLDATLENAQVGARLRIEPAGLFV
jgi:hypothetical protein